MPITISDKDLPLVHYILLQQWYYMRDSITVEHYHDSLDKEAEFCKIKGISREDFEGDDDLQDEFSKWIHQRIKKEQSQLQKILARMEKKI